MRIDLSRASCDHRISRGTGVSPVRPASWLWLLLCLFTCGPAFAADQPKWMSEPNPAPMSADQTRTFMKRLAEFVADNHLKKKDGSPQRGMVYEYLDVRRKGQFDQFVQGEALDTMHDGTWFATALVSAYRATGDRYYYDLLTQWILPFYCRMLNHSDELFALRDDSDPKSNKFGKEHLLIKGEKGFVPYWWDDGGSVSLERRRKKQALGEFQCADNLAGKANPDCLLDGYSLGCSNHLAQDLGVMLMQSWLLLQDHKDDPAAANLLAEVTEAARNLHASRLRHHGSIPMVAAPLAVMGDEELRKRLDDPNSPIFYQPASVYYRSLYAFKPGEKFSMSGFADGQEYLYYCSIARTPGQLAKPVAFKLLYDALTNALLYRVYADDWEVPPGINVFDLHPYTLVDGRPTDYRSDRKGPRGGPRPVGSRMGPQNMVVCGWALQAMKIYPGLWTEQPESTRSPKAPELTTKPGLPKVPKLALLGDETAVKARLERELGGGLRTWQSIMDEMGYIPSGIGTGQDFDHFSDTGGYAHLLKAAAMWLMYLDDQRDWEKQDRSLLTVDRIFGKAEEFKPQDWGPARWLKDASAYCTLEDSADQKDGKDLVRCDPASGALESLVRATQLIPAGQDKPLKIDDYALSDDLSRLLVFTNTKKVWRQNTRGDYWVLDRASARLQKLGGKAEPSTLMFATLSPDGRRIAYVCHNNLYVQNLDDLAITQLTSDGSDTIVNGTSDWVYEEEFALRKAFRWSPDGKYVAYWQFDTSGVREFALVDNIDGTYPKITTLKYPKVGEQNSACRVGVVPSAGGATRWFKPNDDPRNHYIPQMEWSPDSTSVVFQQLNRLQNTNQVIRGDAATGEIRTVFTDKGNAWIEVVTKWHWLEKGARFLWTSERDGWEHLYAVSTADGEAKLLTPGKFDVTSIAAVDEKRGCVYIIASPDNPTQRYLYRVPLDGSGKLTRLMPDGQPGTHSYDISKDNRWAFHTLSRFGQPPVIDLVSLPDHKPIRTLADNAKLRAKLADLKPCPSEFLRVDIGGGVQLDAWCIKPPDFDASRKYPLLIHVYGEPAGQTVADRWGGENYLWHCLLAQQGYLVMSIDNRGTASPRGRDWRKCIYRQIGILASADQAAATRKILETRPYVDAARIGIWGWSGGGSMTLNAIFRYPDLYRTAMAIAFISNQKLYDTVYQERYMGLPADNEAGYRDGSPITFAAQLKGNLLLVHGTADDNCHYQSCELLVNELIKQNKLFSTMPYPNRTHSIKEGENTKRHLYGTMTQYLKKNLPTERSEEPTK